jgi:hypothetical protein
MNFNDQTVTWDTGSIPMKETDTNEPQTLRDEYSQAIKILDTGYKQTFAILDAVIKTCISSMQKNNINKNIIPEI